MDALGSAIHAYLATVYGRLTDDQRLELAKCIMRNWKVELAVESSEVVADGQRLTGFLDQHYPGYQAFREWPMSLRDKEGQLIQGWIDLLLKCRMAM